MRVAVDFDGVIYDKTSGTIIPGADKALQDIKKAGNEILIFTSRPDYARGDIKAILEAHNVPYDQIQGGKPFYDLFIDDRALHFTDWLDLKEVIPVKKWVTKKIGVFFCRHEWGNPAPGVRECVKCGRIESWE